MCSEHELERMFSGERPEFEYIGVIDARLAGGYGECQKARIASIVGGGELTSCLRTEWFAKERWEGASQVSGK